MSFNLAIMLRESREAAPDKPKKRAAKKTAGAAKKADKPRAAAKAAAPRKRARKSAE